MTAWGIPSHYDINLPNLSRLSDYFEATGCKLCLFLEVMRTAHGYTRAKDAGGRPERPPFVRLIKLLTQSLGLSHPGRQPRQGALSLPKPLGGRDKERQHETPIKSALHSQWDKVATRLNVVG